MKRNLLLLAMLAAVFLSAGPALADDIYVVMGGGRAVGTAITSVPYTITEPGFYYLKSNLNRNSGTAISIQASDVTLDLMGFCLSGNGLWYGITTGDNLSNIEVRNGTVRNFSTGIRLSGVGNRILKMTTRNNLNTGILLAQGSSCSTIKGCHAEGNTNYGFNIKSGGVIIGNIASNNNIGFWLNNIPEQFVDRNSSYNNVEANWVGENACTWGINTP